MLHIPSNKPSLIRENRFNKTGHACSYVSSSPFIAWIECKLPGKFQLAKYNISKSGQEKQLIRLDIRPLHFYRHFIKPYGEENEKNLLTKLCKFFPLVMACSITSSKENQIAAEYWIPQILMSWVEENKEFAGVRYFSATKENIVRNYEEFNMALIVGKTDKNGYSKLLKENLGVEFSKGNLFDVNIQDLKEHFSPQICCVENFYMDLIHKI